MQARCAPAAPQSECTAPALGRTSRSPRRNISPYGRGKSLLGDEPIPLGQRLYDNPFLLLVAGIVIMVVFYTGWGLWEILSLPPAPLP
jgi:hypothetical protein